MSNVIDIAGKIADKIIEDTTPHTVRVIECQCDNQLFMLETDGRILCAECEGVLPGRHDIEIDS